MKNKIDNPQTLTSRPTEGIEKNPLEALEAKILNALTNYETHSKTATELEAQAKEARETAQMNLQAAEEMKAKKEKIIEAAQLLKGLGEEAKIAIELAGHQPGPNPEPTAQEAGPTEEGQDAEAGQEEKKAESSTGSTSTSTSGDKAIALPVCCDVEGYSFKFDGDTVEKNLIKFQLLTPGNKEMEGAAILTTAGGANVGMRSRESEAMVYTSNEKFPVEWETHLVAIETALQRIKLNPELKISLPHRAATEAKYRDNGLIILNIKTAEPTKECNGHQVSFVEIKDYKLSNKEYTGVALKVVGEGTTSIGREVFCSFEPQSTEYAITCKDATGKQFKDSSKAKRESMPREFEAIRHAAIAWMNYNFPYTSAKWESQVTYTAAATDKQPANVAAAPAK
jgi:hypothetical protein